MGNESLKQDINMGQTALENHEFKQADIDYHSLFKILPDSLEVKKLRKRLLQHLRQALEDFSMINPGERWLVAVSGGKDSYGLLALLLDLQWRGLLPVTLLACNLDQGQPDFPKEVLPNFFQKYNIPYYIAVQDTYSIVTEKLSHSQTYCSLCSRLRRGSLYNVARQFGCNNLVLGHHREDALETFFLNLFHAGRLATMPGKLVNDEGDIKVLRPLLYVAEDDLAKFAKVMQFPIIPCNLCGSQEGLQRNAMKRMLENFEKAMPGRKDTMIRALGNVRLSHLLDNKVFDFANLQASFPKNSLTD